MAAGYVRIVMLAILMTLCSSIPSVGHSSALDTPVVTDAVAPLDVLRENVERGITILKDPQYADLAAGADQRNKLCEIMRNAFDARLFSRFALAANWDNFSDQEQSEFVGAIESRLCNYYLSRLEDIYTDQTVVFLRQDVRSDSSALVMAEVHHQNTRVPITIRMRLREGGWMAFDVVVMGVRSARLYRAELDSVLNYETPMGVIRGLQANAVGQD